MVLVSVRWWLCDDDDENGRPAVVVLGQGQRNNDAKVARKVIAHTDLSFGANTSGLAENVGTKIHVELYAKV
jgi:hypothetical protein